MELNKKDQSLVRLALDLIKKRNGPYSTVGAALETASGKTFSGINVEQIHASPCSMCAEYAAIGSMQSDDDHSLETVVAITADEKVLPPCGKCREMLRQFGNPFIILKKGSELFKVRLEKLIPHWELI